MQKLRSEYGDTDSQYPKMQEIFEQSWDYTKVKE